MIVCPIFASMQKKHNDRYTLVFCRSSESRKEMMPPITATARVLEESVEFEKGKKPLARYASNTIVKKRKRKKKVSFLQDRDLERPSYHQQHG
jgi:hypothetical protein